MGQQQQCAEVAYATTAVGTFAGVVERKTTERHSVRKGQGVEGEEGVKVAQWTE